MYAASFIGWYRRTARVSLYKQHGLNSYRRPNILHKGCSPFLTGGGRETPMKLEDAQTATGKKTFQADISVEDTFNIGSVESWDGSASNVRI